MPIYNAPLNDLGFVLHEVLKVQDSALPGYEDLTADFTSAVLRSGQAGARCLCAAQRGGRPAGLCA